MNEDIDALSVRIERLLSIMQKLSTDNERLRKELDHSTKDQQQMLERMGEARIRVEAALARLPAADPVSQTESEHAGEHA